ncbi:hypothetical protein HID58_016688 [Brassica napus]|uniref:Uncharacterized protein n=1 Tax=Brassica napus TaxID=3708 RepID=A0ABQ7XHA0_BRANA|nr:hypothetical protein HID58_016688 [Brassica napus]
MHDVEVEAPPRIHLDPLRGRGGLDPRSAALNGDCGVTCGVCGGLAPGLIVLYSEVFNFVVEWGFKRSLDSDLVSRCLSKVRLVPKGDGDSVLSKRARWITRLCGHSVSVVCACNRSSCCSVLVSEPLASHCLLVFGAVRDPGESVGSNVVVATYLRPVIPVRGGFTWTPA